MSVNHLGMSDFRSLLVLERHGNISEAADALSITQPALSERLQKIEQALGVTLFERSRRGTAITPIGREVLVHARQVLTAAEGLEVMVNREQAPLTRSFSFGVIPTLGPYYIPYLLPLLAKQYPNLELNLREEQTDLLLNTIREGLVDAGIVALPFDTSGLVTKHLFSEPFILAARKGHRLLSKPKLSKRDLNANEMMLLEKGHCLSDHSLDICTPSRRNGGARVHATSLETLRHMVASSDRYSLFPALAVGRNPTLKKLIGYREFDDPKPSRKIALVWREHFPRSEDITSLINLIRNNLPEDVMP